MAYCSANRCMAYGAWVCRNHQTNGYINFLVDIFLGIALGHRRIDVWIGHALSWNESWQFCVLGFTSAFGALVPSIYYNFHPEPGKTTFNDLLTTSWGRIVLVGVVLCLIGIYICGKAGVMKERELPEEKKKESIKEFNLTKGLIVCIISGILSACFNYGIEAARKWQKLLTTCGSKRIQQKR
jgi:hypothetical protein